MNPKDVSSWLSQYQTIMQDHREALAQQYIENNIELLETDIDEFLGNCSLDYVLEVIAILKAAGIEVTDALQRGIEQDTKNELLRAGNSCLKDACTLKYYEPKDDWSGAWVSYDLAADKDVVAWKGDWSNVERNI